VPGGKSFTAVWALLRAASNAESSVVNCFGRGGMPVVVVVTPFVVVVTLLRPFAPVDVPFPLGPFEWTLPPELDPLPTDPWTAVVLLEDDLARDADGDVAPLEHAAVAMARAARRIVSRTNGGTVLALICCTATPPEV
jgi:hypothetical protein